MQTHYLWWLIALALGVLELLTGTFYLLVLALGCVAGGAAAFAGFGLTVQLLVTAVVTFTGWFLLRRLRPSTGGAADANRDVILDIGERVQVKHWDAHGRTHVHYRGAQWSAEIDPAFMSPSIAPGEYVIRSVTGNRLILGPVG